MMNKPKSKRQLIDEGAYCNKEHKDKDLPAKDNSIENYHVYCDWCPYYYECTDSPCSENLRNPKESE